MSHLHTIHKPELLNLCLRTAQSGDSLLFIENGVYCAQSEHCQSIPADLTLYALQNDVDARGLVGRIASKAELAEDADFIRLCCEHDKIINWF